MKKIILFCTIAILVNAKSFSQTLKQSMTVTVVEYASFLTGANSHMLVTYPDGTQETFELKGLFAIANYLSEKNLRTNDNTVTKKINELLQQGWSIVNFSTAVRPDSENAPCIIITRYILAKSK